MSGNLDLDRAREYFAEAEASFTAEGGKLWGLSLDGPMIFVDYETREAVANQPDGEGELKLRDGVWVGVIPPEVMIANTAMTWAGVHWTMVLWQALPEEPMRRAALLAHEAFHRIQDEIGLPMPEIPNANGHLDTLEGRTWMQLEWRALEQALFADGETRRRAIGDALLFRASRRAHFPTAAVEERALEMHEGLAEYTGLRVSGLAQEQVADHIREAPSRYPSFVRSFAYASGPGYGFLLDEAAPAWRAGLTPEDDLGELLRAALGLTLPEPRGEHAAKRAEAYDGMALRAREEARERERQAEIAAYRERLWERPVLILPLSEGVQCAFDPRATVPIPDLGTVFPFVHVSDEWGVLDVAEGGLLMASDWKTARIRAPEEAEGSSITGEGWTLALRSGSRVQRGRRPDDVLLVEDG